MDAKLLHYTDRLLDWTYVRTGWRRVHVTRWFAMAPLVYGYVQWLNSETNSRAIIGLLSIAIFVIMRQLLMEVEHLMPLDRRRAKVAEERSWMIWRFLRGMFLFLVIIYGGLVILDGDWFKTSFAIVETVFLYLTFGLDSDGERLKKKSLTPAFASTR